MSIKNLFKNKKYMTLAQIDELRLNGLDTRFNKPYFLEKY